MLWRFILTIYYNSSTKKRSFIYATDTIQQHVAAKINKMLSNNSVWWQHDEGDHTGASAVVDVEDQVGMVSLNLTVASCHRSSITLGFWCDRKIIAMDDQKRIRLTPPSLLIVGHTSSECWMKLTTKWKNWIASRDQSHSEKLWWWLLCVHQSQVLPHQV